MPVEYPKGIIWKSAGLPDGKSRHIGIYYVSTKEFDSTVSYWHLIDFNIYLKIAGVVTQVGTAVAAGVPSGLDVQVNYLPGSGNHKVLHSLVRIPGDKIKTLRGLTESTLINLIAANIDDLIAQPALQFKMKELK